jgi:hypothetical protein
MIRRCREVPGALQKGSSPDFQDANAGIPQMATPPHENTTVLYWLL